MHKMKVGRKKKKRDGESEMREQERRCYCSQRAHGVLPDSLALSPISPPKTNLLQLYLQLGPELGANSGGIVWVTEREGGGWVPGERWWLGKRGVVGV